MSVWSTLGQMVQGTLEQALGEEEINKNVTYSCNLLSIPTERLHARGWVGLVSASVY